MPVARALRPVGACCGKKGTRVARSRPHAPARAVAPAKGIWERRAECPGAVPVLFVHDEVVVEAPADAAGAAAEWLRRAMADGMAPLIAPVPVEVEATVGRTWGG